MRLKMWSSKTYSLILTGISGFATLSNLVSFDYIKKTFDTRGNVFYILAQDSLTTALGSGLYFITNVINLIDEDVLKNKIGCVVHFIGLYLPCMLGATTTLMISLRRFVLLKYPALLPHNSRMVNWIASITIAFVSVYFLVILLLSTWMDLKNFDFIEHCLGNYISKETPRVSLVSIKGLNSI